MQLPAQADLLALGVTAVSLVGTLVYLVRGGRLLWVVVAGAAMTVVFGGLSVATIGYTCKVVRISGERTPVSERTLLLGSTSAELGGKDVPLSCGDDDTLVINATSRTLRIHAEVYSELPYPPPAPPDVTIAPQSVGRSSLHIDNIGPDEPLPSEVSSETSTTTKSWLTW